MKPLGRSIVLVVGLILVSACSTMSKDNASKIAAPAGEEGAAQARVADLEVEVARLKSDNARLMARLLEIKRENEKLAATNEAAPSAQDSQQPVVEANLRDRPSLAVPTPAPQPNAVVEEAASPDLKNGDVPVASAPRMVQPTFASTDAVFENEAGGDEIETQSVLFGVHLASYRRAADARTGWAKLQRDYPDELGLLEPRIRAISIPGKGDFLRLIGGGFSSREKAAALCASLKDKGFYCAVTSFEGQRLSLGAG